MKNNTQLIFALDVENYQKAMRWVKLLYPKINLFKVGLQLYTACGPKIIQDIRKTGAEVFLDLKLHDIPHTMACAAKEAVKQKVAFLTVHTFAGPEALKAAASVCRGSKTKVIGVTILTSICPHFLKDLSVQRPLREEILYLARLAKRSGLAGVVCSAQEAGGLRKKLGRNFLIVTPGIRPSGSAKADQKRVATAAQAKKAGADYIVVGRPILQASNPLKVTQEILQELRG